MIDALIDSILVEHLPCARPMVCARQTESAFEEFIALSLVGEVNILVDNALRYAGGRPDWGP